MALRLNVLAERREMLAPSVIGPSCGNSTSLPIATVAALSGGISAKSCRSDARAWRTGSSWRTGGSWRTRGAWRTWWAGRTREARSAWCAWCAWCTGCAWLASLRSWVTLWPRATRHVVADDIDDEVGGSGASTEEGLEVAGSRKLPVTTLATVWPGVKFSEEVDGTPVASPGRALHVAIRGRIHHGDVGDYERSRRPVPRSSFQRRSIPIR